MVQVSKPSPAKYSIAEECGRPGTCRSKVGCAAIEEPCTKRIVPRGLPTGACLLKRKSLMSPFFVQCSVPFIGAGSFCVGESADFMQESAGLRRLEEGPDGGRHRNAGYVSEAA